MRTALVISGGGSRGAFAVGALEALRERGVTFDLVSGTSTGALVAPLAAIDEVQLLRTIYSSVRTDDIIQQRDLVSVLLSDALYSSHPLWSLLNSFISDAVYQRILDSSVELFLTTVNLQTGGIEYWNQHGLGHPSGQPLSRRTLLRAIFASASIPVMMPPVEIEEGGDQYVDGGVREIAPLKIVIDHGATDVYAIVLSPESEEREDDRYVFVVKTLTRIINLFTQEVALNDLGVARLYNRAVVYQRSLRQRAETLIGAEQARALFDDVDVPDPFADARLVNLYVIRPERALPSSGLEFRPLLMSQMMAMGREAALRAVAAGPLPHQLA